jgi:hypothetical protein
VVRVMAIHTKIAAAFIVLLLSCNPLWAAEILVTIDKSKQQMTVFVDGEQKYEWLVSTGRPGYSTPSGSYTATSMNEIWYSKQWDNAPMPHSIFFMKDGHAMHGTASIKNLGRPASHGCVRIAPENATILYQLVKDNGLENTKVEISGDEKYAKRMFPEENARATPPKQQHYYPRREYRQPYAPPRQYTPPRHRTNPDGFNPFYPPNFR